MWVLDDQAMHNVRDIAPKLLRRSAEGKARESQTGEDKERDNQGRKRGRDGRGGGIDRREGENMGISSPRSSWKMDVGGDQRLLGFRDRSYLGKSFEYLFGLIR